MEQQARYNTNLIFISNVALNMQAVPFPMICTFSAMASMYFLRDDEEKKSMEKINYNQEIKILLLSIFDLLCVVVSYTALLSSGSLVFQLIFSSILIQTACIRHFLIPNKQMNIHQWIACFIVTFGLLIVGLSPNDEDKTGGISVVNFVHCLSGTAMFALEFVMTEILLNDKSMSVSTTELCWKEGVYNFMFVCMYLLMFVMPRLDELFWSQIEAHNGSAIVIIFCYLGFFFGKAGLNWSYFSLLKNSGSVSTGIISALQTILVFIISAICFCHLEASQCFNMHKFVSLIVVMIGVMRYTQITNKLNTKSANE